MNSLEIKYSNELHPGYLTQVAQLHAKVYFNEFKYNTTFESYVLSGLSDFHSELLNGFSHKVFFASRDEKVIGSLFALDRGKQNQLRLFIIDNEFRGLGIGKKLMINYLNHVQASNYNESFLWTTNEQFGAIELYKSFGYQLEEEKITTRFGKELVEQKFKLIIE